MPIMKNALVGWLTIAFLLLWAGPLTGATPESSEKRPPEAEEGASVEEVEKVPYSYDPEGKTDPFDPFIVEKTADLTQIREGDAAGEKLRKMLALMEEMKRPRTELQKIPLSAIQLTAILKTEGKSVAMVKGPEGAKGFMLEKGTKIGQNAGVVEEIISEEQMTDLGKQLIRKVVIKELDDDQDLGDLELDDLDLDDLDPGVFRYRYVELKMPGSFD